MRKKRYFDNKRAIAKQLASKQSAEFGALLARNATCLSRFRDIEG